MKIERSKKTFCLLAFVFHNFNLSNNLPSFILILDDAQLLSQYAKKKSIDADDVKLAIQLQVEKTYSNPPPRELLLDIARNKNSQCLPLIKSNAGTRLPPDRYSLISCNYKLKPANQLTKPQHTSQFHY